MDEEGRRVPVIAKVEKPQAVDNMEEVVEAFDAVMVARGDLAVEYPLEKVPMVQKRLVEMCRRNAKPVIVATQMMESMITNSRPTRAEASDVANAILDGADAVMLSAESSVGAYPIETVKTMSKIVEAAEEELLSKGLQPLVPGKKPRTQGGSVARAACEIADFLDGKALIAFTKSGDTARRLSRYRAAQPILAFTTDAATRNQLALSWGVESYVVPHVDNTDAMVDLVDAELLKLQRYNKGDTDDHHRRFAPRRPRHHQHGPGAPPRRPERLTRPRRPCTRLWAPPVEGGGPQRFLRLPDGSVDARALSRLDASGACPGRSGCRRTGPPGRSSPW